MASFRNFTYHGFHTARPLPAREGVGRICAYIAGRVGLPSVVLILLLAAGVVRADTFTYSTVRRQIRVGIVVSHALDVPGKPDPATGKPILESENADPYVFYIADSRSDLKPLGYEFVNPLAPSVVTTDIYQRWQNRVRPGFTDPAFTSGTPQTLAFSVGAHVTKNMGAYWEVNIDSISPRDLSQFDVLYLASHKHEATFSPEVREKLRRFVDGGGTLWVENLGSFSIGEGGETNVDGAQTNFLEDVQMFSGGGSAGAGAVVAAPNHPLLTVPYILSPPEVQRLGDHPPGAYYLYNPFVFDPTGKNPPARIGAPGNNASNPPGATVLAPVVWNSLGLPPGGLVTPNPGWRPYILAGQIGAGRLIFTSQGSGNAINNYAGSANAGYGGNSGAVSGENLLSAPPQDLKFLYNLVSWTNASSTALGDVRHTDSTSERIGAVLLEKWSALSSTAPANNRVGGAIYFKSCIFSVDGNLVLHCYDAKPNEDLDGDGNPDEGLPDLIAGAPYDEIWRLNLKQFAVGSPTSASTPTAIEFYDPSYIAAKGQTTNTLGQNPTGQSITLANYNERELILVALSDGTTLAVRAFPRQATPGLPLAMETVLEWKFPNGALGNPNFGNVTDYPNYPTSSSGNALLPVPSPVFSEGVVFVAVNTTIGGGRVVALDPRNGTGAMQTDLTGYQPAADPSYSSVPDAAGGATPPPVLGTPTVGYVEDAASGAVDRIVYIHSQGNTNSGNLGQSNEFGDSVRAYWFSTKGEPLTQFGASGTQWASRADRFWYVYNDPVLDPQGTHTNPLLRPRVYRTFRSPNGVYLSEEFQYVAGGASQAATLQPGQFAVDWKNNRTAVYLAPTQTNPDPSYNGGNPLQSSDPADTYYADYTLDWGPRPSAINPVPPPVTARDVFNAPDPQHVGAQIGGPPALSADDFIYFTTAGVAAEQTTTPGAGAIFGLSEQYLRSTLKWAFSMHNGFDMPVNGSATVTVPPRLRQLDRYLPGYGSYITNVQLGGTPAIYNGVAYAVATGQLTGNTPVSLLLAFKANPDLVLHLNTKIDPGTPVRIRQVNPILSSLTGTTTQPQFVEMVASQFSVDYSSGTIHLTALAPPGTINNFVSTSVPFLVTIGNSPEQVIAGQQIDVDPNGNRTVRMIGAPGVDNLLWYAVIPAAGDARGLPSMGAVTASPVVQGNVVWLGFKNGLATFDSDPTLRDPQFQTTGSQVSLHDGIGTDRTIGHLRWAQLIPSGDGMLAAPMAVNNVLAVNTPSGVRAYEDSLTVIADSRRLIEVNSGSDATWVSDSTRTFSVAGGQLPQYAQDANGNVIITNQAAATGVPVMATANYAHPSVVRHVGANDLLVVDTGNNRVVQIDRGGNVAWTVHTISDDFRKALRQGDPLSLNAPEDAQYWVEYPSSINAWFVNNLAPPGTAVAQDGPGTVVHYLVADTGNFRVLELVDIYDQAGNPVRAVNSNTPGGFTMLRQVNFVSSSYGVQGRQYRYRTVQRITMRNSDLPPAWQKNPFDANQPPLPIRQLTLSAISNVRLSGTFNPSTGTFVEVNPSDPNAGGQVFRPESGGGSLVVLNEAGNILSIIANLRVSAGNAAVTQPIVNPTSFSAFQEAVSANGQPVVIIKYLLTDANGAYQLSPWDETTGRPAVDPISGAPVLNVEWMLTAGDYYAMTGKRLDAVSIRRLSTAAPNGFHHMLITNRFNGADNPSAFGITYNTSGNPGNGNISAPGAFHGEVFEVDPSKYDPSMGGHGYVPDFTVAGNFLLPNDGTTHVIGNTTVTTPVSSIVFRAPRETVPQPPDFITNPSRPFAGEVGSVRRTIGSSNQGTTTTVLEQPASADRPF